jgi:hypothetical protein
MQENERAHEYEIRKVDGGIEANYRQTGEQDKEFVGREQKAQIFAKVRFATESHLQRVPRGINLKQD